MADLDGFINKVLDQFAESVTDQVFLMIEKDKKLMKEYLDLVSEKSLKAVNPAIGKAVKKRFALNNVTIEQETKSVLIQSYSTHT